MSNPTSNFGWQMPTSTDLVTDLPADFEVFGQAVDSDFVDLLGGTTGQILSKTSATDLDFTWVTPGGVSLQSATFNDTKSSGTAGGTFTNGAWRTRDLNTSQFNNITSASLSSNQISLPAGTYYVVATATAFYTNEHQLRVQNITDSTTAILGLNTGTGQQIVNAVGAPLSGTFTIAGTKTFELQHRAATTKADNGFGVPASWGNEIYAIISIVKVA